MINATERKKLRKIIGFRWISKLNAYFIDEQIKNRYDEPYTSQYISLVFNGKVENEKIESAIYDFASKRKKEDEAEEERRKSILED